MNKLHKAVEERDEWNLWVVHHDKVEPFTCVQYSPNEEHDLNYKSQLPAEKHKT